MLSKRIIGSLIVKDGTVVQSFGMSRYLPVGSPEVAIEFLNSWGVDEIVILDVSASERREPNFGLVERLSRKCRVPLTVGGGVHSISSAQKLITGGADKIVINTAAKERPELIRELSMLFGNQCVVVSIDVRAEGGTAAVEQAVNAAKLGAGEILLRSVERDGSKRGFDAELVRRVAAMVNIPVVAAGGCANAAHAKEAFDAGASAVAVGNILHFAEHSVVLLKQQLRRLGVSVRLDTHATYEHARFSGEGRLLKQDDAVLQKLRFEYHPPETI